MCSLKAVWPALLVAAVAQNPDDDNTLHPEENIDINFVLDACCNLLILDATGVFRLSHLSVHEYFEEHH